MIPGPRTTVVGAFPTVPTAGSAKQLGLKLCVKLLSLFEMMGLQVRTVREPCDGVPVISRLFVVVKPTPAGAPLINDVMPESAHPFSTQRDATFFHGALGAS